MGQIFIIIFAITLIVLYIFYYKQRLKKEKEIEKILEELNNNLTKNKSTKIHILSELLHYKSKHLWDEANMINLGALEEIEECRKEGREYKVKLVYKFLKNYYL